MTKKKGGGGEKVELNISIYKYIKIILFTNGLRFDAVAICKSIYKSSLSA
jgi:hypothetical protein